MSDKQREKDLKELTSFSKISLKTKLNLAIEKNDTAKVEELISLAEKNNFDVVNQFTTNDYQYYTVIHSILNLYVKELKSKDKSQKNDYNKDYSFDFSLLDSLIEKGLNFKQFFQIMDHKKDFFDIIFQTDFTDISSKRSDKFFEGFLSRLNIDYMDFSLHRYLNLNSYNSFHKEVRGNKVESFNSGLFNSLISYHRINDIPLLQNNNDLERLSNFINNHYSSIEKENLKFIIESSSDEFCFKNENFEYVMRLLLIINSFDYALNFFESRNLNFNDEMNKKYTASKYDNNEDIPLMAKLIISPNEKYLSYFQEHPVLNKLSEHFNFKYENTLFSSVFKEEYYLSNNNYYSSNQQELEKMIEKGMDFYSEDPKTGLNIFDYATAHQSSKFFMQSYKEKKGWGINYENDEGINILNKLIISHDLKAIKNSRKTEISNNYFIDLFKDEYKESFIPDNLINTLLSYPESLSAKAVFEDFSKLANPDFKDEDGNNLTMAYLKFPFWAYSPDITLPKGLNTDEINNKGECFLHILFKNPNYQKRIKLLENISSIPPEIYMHCDNEGHTPFYYLKKSYEYPNSGDLLSLSFEMIKNIMNYISVDFLLEQQNTFKSPLTDILHSYSSIKHPEEIANFKSLMEKKTIEYTLHQNKKLNNILDDSSPEQNSVKGNKKRL